MKCVSCEVEINPKWRHAIDINICPFCGSEILEEHLKNLLTSLSETMAKLQDYPDQLNDWLLSNYNFIKTDSPDLKSYVPKDLLKEAFDEEKEKEFQQRKEKRFTVKVQNEAGVEEDILVEKTQSDAETNNFFKRAEVVKPKLDGFHSTAEKTEYLKKMAQQIRREGSAAVLGESGGVAKISPEMMENADPDAVAEMEAELLGGSVNSSLSIDDEDSLPPVVEQMLARGGMSNNDAQGAQILMNMQSRAQQSKKAFENGENRASKGGGFSRI